MEPPDELRSVRFEIAWSSTAVIEIDSRIRITSRENKSDSIQAKQGRCRSRLVVASPGRGIRATRRFAGQRRDRQLDLLPANALPTHPLLVLLKLARNHPDTSSDAKGSAFTLR